MSCVDTVHQASDLWRRQLHCTAGHAACSTYRLFNTPGCRP